MYTWGYIKTASLAKLDLTEKEATSNNLLSRFPIYANEVITQICSAVKPKPSYYNFAVTDSTVGIAITMPSDFISFGDDVNYVLIEDEEQARECSDEDFLYYGYNKVICFKVGEYRISYNARWITFDTAMDNDFELEVPIDILECIPSYIAHQCYKLDDEERAAIYRNEYELFLSRIDNTSYKNTKTMKIGGDWA